MSKKELGVSELPSDETDEVEIKAGSKEEGQPWIHRLDLSAWVAHTTQLLQAEKEEEIKETQENIHSLTPQQAQETGNSILRLVLDQSTVGLFGRSILELRHFKEDTPLPANRFSVGDIVQVRLLDGSNEAIMKDAITGVVTKMTEKRLCMAVDDDASNVLDDLNANARFRVDRLANDVTYRKMSDALKSLSNYAVGGPASRLINIAFHGTKMDNHDLEPFTPFTLGLNESQIRAVSHALASKDFSLIHGPPGTGKTTTVVELIVQAVQRKKRCLVCAPSNIAVDNIITKLPSTIHPVSQDGSSSPLLSLRIVRVGHPARLLPEVTRVCLDSFVQRSDGRSIVQDVKRELEDVLRRSSRTKQTRHERTLLRKEMKSLRKEVRMREEKIVAEIIKTSHVVCTTNVGAASRVLAKEEFDLVIIDEAAQALEASCWIPLLKAKTCVLAGDHCQLPPTIQSKKAKRLGLDVTLFDRIRMLQEGAAVHMLDTQYRMHRDISDWSSQAMYHGKLISHSSVAGRLLKDLSHVSCQKELEDDIDMVDCTLLLLDTAGCDLKESQNEQSLSRFNEGEAAVVVCHVQALLAAGLLADEIAVITPYNGQVEVIKSLFLATTNTQCANVQVRSVDGFQGCEKEAVVLSLVRSNLTKEVGFLNDDRRMNVAITRAKRHCAVICDTDTVTAHPFMKTLIEHFEKHGEHRSAQEYLDRCTPSLEEGGIERPTSMILQPITTTSLMPLKTRSEHPTGQMETTTKKKKKAFDSQSRLIDDVVSAPHLSSEKENGEVAKEDSNTEDVRVDTKALTLEEDCYSSEEGLDEQLDSNKSNGFNGLLIASSSDEDESDAEATAALSSVHFVDPDENTANVLVLDATPCTTKDEGRMPHEPTKAMTKQSTQKKKKKQQQQQQQQKTSKLTASLLQDSSLTEDEIVEKALKCSNVCSHSLCKQSILTVGVVCKYCKLKFCFKHGQPEVHGCGDEARRQERRKFIAQGKAPIEKPMKASTRKDLQRALQKNLDASSLARKTKEKKKN